MMICIITDRYSGKLLRGFVLCANKYKYCIILWISVKESVGIEPDR